MAPARPEDTAAFNELLQRCQPMCLRRAYSALHNRNDAEDTVQTAFRKALQCRDQFQGTGTFGAWLGRIVENECLMQIRKGRYGHLVHLDKPTESNVRIELVDSNENPEDDLGREEVESVLHQEISRMPVLSETSSFFTTVSICRCPRWRTGWEFPSLLLNPDCCGPGGSCAPGWKNIVAEKALARFWKEQCIAQLRTHAPANCDRPIGVDRQNSLEISKPSERIRNQKEAWQYLCANLNSASQNKRDGS
jgi:RNA polymerase sigma factor (sigma-70 family)